MSADQLPKFDLPKPRLPAIFSVSMAAVLLPSVLMLIAATNVLNLLLVGGVTTALVLERMSVRKSVLAEHAVRAALIEQLATKAVDEIRASGETVDKVEVVDLGEVRERKSTKPKGRLH